jgi:hypothetical protein
VDGKAVATAEQFDAAVQAARGAGKTAVAMRVETPAGGSFVAVPFEADEEDAG